jgi:Ca2+-binding EF-hand superfamily protein
VAEEALGVEEAVARIGRVLLEERARVMDLFTKWDTNKDGYVSKREFREAMAALQIPVRGEDVLALFAYFDPDESGAISFQELNTFFRSSRNSMAGSTAEAARAAAGAFT